MIYFKFKNVKHSVLMQLLKAGDDGIWILANKDYPSFHYKAYRDELEPVEITEKGE